jgi:hypothetical protein
MKSEIHKLRERLTTGFQPYFEVSRIRAALFKLRVERRLLALDRFLSKHPGTKRADVLMAVYRRPYTYPGTRSHYFSNRLREKFQWCRVCDTIRRMGDNCRNPICLAVLRTVGSEKFRKSKEGRLTRDLESTTKLAVAAAFTLRRIANEQRRDHNQRRN